MKVTLTDDVIENYGEKWRDVPLTVASTANKYMPASEFFAKGKPSGYHPGYDTSMNGMPLYDLVVTETGAPVPFSLYAWEVKQCQ